MLHFLRFPVEASRGRRYPEPEHPYRTAFQRDRDRIIHSRAFRRLEQKTQVFAPELCDHFRNRLTHTMEVAQVARTIANVLGLNEDLTEALALSHDVGHPPFAHAGETALDQMMRQYGDRFDHNSQSLRVLDEVERSYPRFPGLNLTFEVREGILKHSRDLPADEASEYLPGFRPTLEAQLIDMADEIAYNAADLDDAVQAGLITAEVIAADVPVLADILDTVETQFPGATERERFLEGVRQMVDHLASGLIQGTVEAAKLAGVQTHDEVRAHPGRIAQFSAEAAETSQRMKHSLNQNVYSSPSVRADRQDSVMRLTRMFEYLMQNPASVPLPEDEDVPLHRAVCDYIAGMTDRYFFRVYGQLFGSI